MTSPSSLYNSPCSSIAQNSVFPTSARHLDQASTISQGNTFFVVAHFRTLGCSTNSNPHACPLLHCLFSFARSLVARLAIVSSSRESFPRICLRAGISVITMVMTEQRESVSQPGSKAL